MSKTGDRAETAALYHSHVYERKHGRSGLGITAWDSESAWVEPWVWEVIIFDLQIAAGHALTKELAEQIAQAVVNALSTADQAPSFSSTLLNPTRIPIDPDD